jgi:hypothetical protein
MLHLCIRYVRYIGGDTLVSTRGDPRAGMRGWYSNTGTACYAPGLPDARNAHHRLAQVVRLGEGTCGGASGKSRDLFPTPAVFSSLYWQRRELACSDSSPTCSREQRHIRFAPFAEDLQEPVLAGVSNLRVSGAPRTWKPGVVGSRGFFALLQIAWIGVGASRPRAATSSIPSRSGSLDTVQIGSNARSALPASGSGSRGPLAEGETGGLPKRQQRGNRR